jgi:hypothetical protein
LKLLAPAKSFAVRLICGPNAGGIGRSAAARASKADTLKTSRIASRGHLIRGDGRGVIGSSKPGSRADEKVIRRIAWHPPPRQAPRQTILSLIYIKTRVPGLV